MLEIAKEKWAHAGFQKYFRNTSWLFMARFCTLAISFFVNIIVVRYLGPHNNGLLSYSVSYVGLFSFIATLGLDQILYRDLVANPEKKDELIGTAFTLKLLGSIVAMLLVISTSFFFEPNSFNRLLIIINSLGFLFTPFGVLGSIFQARVISKYYFISYVLVTAILATMKLLVVHFNKGVIFFSLILLSENLLYIPFSLYFYTKKIGSVFTLRFVSKTGKYMLKAALPLILSSVFVYIYTRIDQVMIRKFMNANSVGIYAVAANLSEVWYFIPALIISSLFPAIINAKKLGEGGYYRRLTHLYSLMFYLSFIVAIPVSIFSKFIIYLIYGSQFIQASTVLRVYVWAGVAVFVNMALGNYFLAEKETNVIFYSTLGGMISNILLNIVLIPRIGILGAALATLISYSFVPIVGILFSKNRNSQARLILKAVLLPFTLWQKKY